MWPGRAGTDGSLVKAKMGSWDKGRVGEACVGLAWVVSVVGALRP